MRYKEKMLLYEECILDLQKQVKRLDRETEAIAKVLVEKVKPVVDAVEYYKKVKQDEMEEVDYIG